MTIVLLILAGVLMDYFLLYRIIHPPRGKVISMEYHHQITGQNDVPDYFVFKVRTRTGLVAIIAPPRSVELKLRQSSLGESVIYPKGLVNILGGRLVYQSAVIYAPNSDEHKRWQDILKI